MAISRDKKESIVAELKDTLTGSKLTVFACYEGLTVKEAQELRKQAKADDTVIKVVKNRLVKVAMGQVEHLKDADTSELKGQLLYAANANDEVASAKTLAQFAKDHPSIKMRGGFDQAGNLLDESTVNQLAALPGKDELRAKLIGTLAAPMGELARVLGANIGGLMNVLKAREQTISD